MLDTIRAWTADVHLWLQTPLGLIVLTWLAIGLCTLIFKPRSAEQYHALATRQPTWLFSRLAALLQFAGALGIDPRKVAAALVKILTGVSLPPDAPPTDKGKPVDMSNVEGGERFKSSLEVAAKRAGAFALVLGGLCILLQVLTGCAWIREHKAMFPTDDDIVCLDREIEDGVDNPVQIVKDCPHLAVLAAEDLATLILGQGKAKKARAVRAATKPPTESDAGVSR